MVGVVVSVDGMCCWSATLEAANFLTAKLNIVIVAKPKCAAPLPGCSKLG